MKFRTAVIAAFIGCFLAMGGVLYLAKPSNASLKAVTAPSGLQNAGSVAITGGTISIPGITQTGGAGNTEYTLAQSAIPLVSGPTGTMANNGVVTWGTALSQAYTGGAWVLMPAGSIAAGVPAAAAILWYVGTDTTHGTFFNSTYTSGVPTAGTATAYSTTGPGAFTGVTAESLTYGIQIPANSLGPNGSIVVDHYYKANSNANAKTGKAYLHTANAVAGTATSSVTMASNTGNGSSRVIENRNSTAIQFHTPYAVGLSSAEALGDTTSTIDTTAAVWINFTLTKSTATDVLSLERIAIRIRYGA